MSAETKFKSNNLRTPEQGRLIVRQKQHISQFTYILRNQKQKIEFDNYFIDSSAELQTQKNLIYLCHKRPTLKGCVISYLFKPNFYSQTGHRVIFLSLVDVF